MLTPYLIQRMIRKEDPPKNPRVDDLYSMDYMGSSEFEWGALSKSLKIFTKNFDSLVIKKSDSIKDFNDSPLCFIGFAEAIDQYQLIIQDLIDGKIMLKERLEFDNASKGGMKRFDGEIVQYVSWRHTTCWWDIKNHVMFLFKKLHANKLKEAIGVVRKNKMKDGEDSWY